MIVEIKKTTNCGVTSYIRVIFFVTHDLHDHAHHSQVAKSWREMREVNVRARIRIFSELFLVECTLGRYRVTFVVFSLMNIDLVPRSRGFRHFRRGIIAHEGSCVRVHTRLRESAHGQTCRNNTVPEVANGWPARLFEMEVSNRRVK